METFADLQLRSELNRVTEHNLILLRRIQDLQKCENRLIGEKNTAVEILNMQLKSSENQKLVLDQKVQSLTDELGGLREENKGFLEKIEEMEMEKRRNQEEVLKLKEKRNEFPKTNKSKVPKFQQYRYDTLKKTLASERKRYVEELNKAKKYAERITGIARSQQQTMRNWHVDHVNAESRRRQHTIKHLTESLAQSEEKLRRQSIMIRNMQIKERNLSSEKQNLLKQLDTVAATQPKKQKLDKLVNNLRNEREEALSSKEDKNAEAQVISIAIGNAANNDNQNGAQDNPARNDRPVQKRSGLGEYAVHHLPLKKQWAFTK